MNDLLLELYDTFGFVRDDLGHFFSLLLDFFDLIEQ
jgi:hypothetical protein